MNERQIEPRGCPTPGACSCVEQPVATGALPAFLEGIELRIVRDADGDRRYVRLHDYDSLREIGLALDTGLSKAITLLRRFDCTEVNAFFRELRDRDGFMAPILDRASQGEGGSQ